MSTELQTTASLIKATVIAFVVGAITLVLFVLPAEYNIDPTGVGEKLGLTVFHQENEVSPESATTTAGSEDAVTVTVPAGRGIEYKLTMQQFSKVKYQWQTDGADIYVDMHGEPPAGTEGYPDGYFESYTIATIDEMKGSFTAPYYGSHGWYFRNTSDKDINIQLIFEGDYAIEGLKK